MHSGYDAASFEKELYRLQKKASSEANESGSALEDKFYVSSLSSQTLTYKGQLTPGQVRKKRK
jgi:glutamate synthase domain-containing protein 1